MGKKTRSYTEYNKIPIDADAPEVVEYVQIALAKTKDTGISDDIKPTVAIQGECVIVIFPGRLFDPSTGRYILGQSGHTEVFIDIETKTATGMLRGGDIYTP